MIYQYVYKCRLSAALCRVRERGSGAAAVGVAQSDGFRSRHTAPVFVMKNDGAKWVSSHSAESQYITVTKSPVSQRDTLKAGDIYRPCCFPLMQHFETKLPSASGSPRAGDSARDGYQSQKRRRNRNHLHIDYIPDYFLYK